MRVISRGPMAAALARVTAPERLGSLRVVTGTTSADTHSWVEREAVELATGTVDFARSRFVRTDGSIERLTTREAEVLAYLVDRADEAVARDDLLGAVWGHHAHSLSRAVDAAMSRLRRKLDPDPEAPKVLFTVHGHGYRLLTAAPPAMPSPRAAAEPGPRRLLRLSDRVVDLGAGFVDGPDGRVQLTARERLLVEQLLRARGQLVAADKLARAVGIAGGRSALSNAISRLRAKLELDAAAEAAGASVLVSVRNEGYRLDVPAPEQPRTRRDEHNRALRSLARHVGLVFGLDDCVVYRVEAGALHQVAAHGPKRIGDGEVRAPLIQAFGEGLVGHAAAERRPIRVARVADDVRYLADLVPAASELSVPIVGGGRVVGVLDSESTRPDAFDERIEQGFVMLAAIAAPAFDSVTEP